MKIRKPVNLILATAFLAIAGCSTSSSAGPYIAKCPHNDFLDGYSDYSSCYNAIQAHEEATGHQAVCAQGIIDGPEIPAFNPGSSG